MIRVPTTTSPSDREGSRAAGFTLPHPGLGEGDGDAVERAEGDLDAATHLGPCVRDLGPEEA
jgi:hypothetical protein